MSEGGLAHAGQILDEQMAASNEAGQRQPQLLFFAEDDVAGGGDHLIEGGLARGGGRAVKRAGMKIGLGNRCCHDGHSLE